MVISNRLAAMKRAKKERDPAAVISAAKGILEIAGDKDLTPEGEAFLEAVADEALEFAGMGHASKSASPNEEVYGYEETRDPMGHRVGVTKAAESRSGDSASIWGSPGGRHSPPDPSEYDEPGHDGRDINGHRVTPLEDLDEPEEAFEDEE